MDEAIDEAGFHLGRVRKIEYKPGGGRDGDRGFCSQSFERCQGIGFGEVKVELESEVAFGEYEVGDEEFASGLALFFVKGESEGDLGGRAFSENAEDEGGIEREGGHGYLWEEGDLALRPRAMD